MRTYVDLVLHLAFQVIATLTMGMSMSNPRTASMKATPFPSPDPATSSPDAASSPARRCAESYDGECPLTCATETYQVAAGGKCGNALSDVMKRTSKVFDVDQIPASQLHCVWFMLVSSMSSNDRWGVRRRDDNKTALLFEKRPDDHFDVKHFNGKTKHLTVMDQPAERLSADKIAMKWKQYADPFVLFTIFEREGCTYLRETTDRTHPEQNKPSTKIRDSLWKHVSNSTCSVRGGHWQSASSARRQYMQLLKSDEVAEVASALGHGAGGHHAGKRTRPDEVPMRGNAGRLMSARAS